MKHRRGFTTFVTVRSVTWPSIVPPRLGQGFFFVMAAINSRIPPPWAEANERAGGSASLARAEFLSVCFVWMSLDDSC